MTISLNLHMGWIIEDNESVNELICGTGPRIYKRYRMLRQPIGNLA
jgi:hypothetical protein